MLLLSLLLLLFLLLLLLLLFTSLSRLFLLCHPKRTTNRNSWIPVLDSGSPVRQNARAFLCCWHSASRSWLTSPTTRWACSAEEGVWNKNNNNNNNNRWGLIGDTTGVSFRLDLTGIFDRARLDLTGRFDWENGTWLMALFLARMVRSVCMYATHAVAAPEIA